MRLQLFAAILVSAAVDAQEPIETWPRLAEGVVEFRTTSEFRTTATFGKRTTNREFVIHSDERVRVTNLQEDGSAVLRVERLRHRGSIAVAIGTRESRVAFDTNEGELPAEAEALLESMAAVLVIEIDKDGVLRTIRAEDESGKLGDDDAHERETMQLQFAQRPTLPLRIGAEWRPRVGVHECTPDGCVELETTNTLTASSATELTITTKSKLASSETESKPSEAAPAASSSVARTLVLSRSDGLPVSVEVTGSQRYERDGQTITISGAVTISRKATIK